MTCLDATEGQGRKTGLVCERDTNAVIARA